MADKYRIGQKVRIIRSDDFPEIVGTECTIVGAREQAVDWDKRCVWFGYKVDVGERNYRPLEEYLEPVYDGDGKSSWSECLWQPKQKETTK